MRSCAPFCLSYFFTLFSCDRDRSPLGWGRPCVTIHDSSRALGRIALSIAQRGNMIPNLIGDATSGVDTPFQNRAYWGERGRGGQAMGYMDGIG